MHKFTSLASALFFLSFFLGYSQNQQSESLRGLKVYEETRFRTLSSPGQLITTEFGLSSENQFTPTSTSTDALGFEHEKYQQYYSGYKVDFGEVSLHRNQGTLESMSYNVFKFEGVNLSPSISENIALEAAKTFVGASIYLWEDTNEAEFLGYSKPKGELVILPGLDNGSSASLAYKFDIYAQDPVYRANIYVHAQTGDVLLEDKIIHEVNTPATGVSLYNGTVAFTADNNAGTYRLRQTANGNGINTYNMNSGTSYASATDFTSDSDSFSADTAKGVQAHWATEQTQKYFLEQHNRNSYDGNGAALDSYVSYGTNYVNAFWNGSQMTYGDGNGVTRGPLTPLDIVGHEIAHGVTQFSANLVYSYESGALNESFSDIFGEAIENYATGSNDWLMSGTIGLGGADGAFRSMANPNLYSHPDTYEGNFWYTGSGDNGGVHFNSGVQNKWFYLLVNGESGINDNGDSYTVSAIGMDKAAEIAYRNLTVYLSRNSQYFDARLGAIQSAIDLYGADSPEEIAVTNAWQAVGVGDAYIVCTDELVNQDDSVVLGSSSFSSGLDSAVGSKTESFGGGCALLISNQDSNQPWARYQIRINLSDNDLQPGDKIIFGIDGKSTAGQARVEVNLDNEANTAVLFSNFASEWSRVEQEITIPDTISFLDIWLFSNYGLSTAGVAVYDNLFIKKIDPENDFVTTWKTDNIGTSNSNQITISTNYNETYNYTVNWGDGFSDTDVTGNITHTYANPGTYQVRIMGEYPRIAFGNSGDRNKLISIDQWGSSKWTSMQSSFYNCTNVQILATDIPDLSIANSTYAMFYNADNMNSDLSAWDFSNITNMSYMFSETDIFNQDITSWNTSNVTNIGNMFSSAEAFNQDLSNLDISSVTNMGNFLSYSGLSSENYDNMLISWSQLEGLNTYLSLGAYGISYCEGAEARQSLIDTYNWNIYDSGLLCPITIPFVSTWKTDNQGSSNDNQIAINYAGSGSYTIDWGDGNLDTEVSENITHTYATSGSYQISISGAFSRINFGATGDRNKLISIDQWGDAKWTSMENAFANCQNVEILATDVPDLSAAISTYRMFYFANSINADLSAWDMSKVTNMSQMFYSADAFNQDLSDWDISSVTSMSNMFSYSGLSSPNYDSMLISWSALEGLNSNVRLDAYGVNYCEGAEARQSLIETYNWTIYDDGILCPITVPFVTTWKTDNQGNSNDNQVTINYPGSGSYTIDWGDGSSDTEVSDNITHTYAASGSYQISISGMYPRIYFGSSGDREKLISVDQWGNAKWPDLGNAFVNCINMQILATDVPDLSAASSTYFMFGNTNSMNSDLSAWDFSNITNMSYMFYGSQAYNQDISTWDTSKVTNMSQMFYSADAFDQDLSNLDISTVTNMSNMFSYSGLSTANYDSMLISWSQLEGLDTYLSLGAYGINYCEGSEARQSLIDTYNWNIYDSGFACPNTIPFVTSWKTDNPGSSNNDQITINYPGSGSYTIDWGDGSSNTGVSTTLTHTYAAVGTYQISISGTYSRIIFGSSGDRNKLVSVDQWGDTKWATMENAFSSCANVQILATDTPDLSQANSLYYMFYNADNMNNDLSAWDFSSITNMGQMFASADSFNQDISDWNTSNVTSMNSMFYNSLSFDQDLSDLDISSVTSMAAMFTASNLSTENYDSMLISWSERQDLNNNVNLGANGTNYCASDLARQTLIDTFNWNFDDSGFACPSTIPFVSSWKTDNQGSSGDNQVTMYTAGSGHYTIDWGDGSTDSNVSANITHTYATPGTYQISISGTYPRIIFGSSPDRNKLVSVDQWGDTKWLQLESAFGNCNNVQILATDAPDLSNLTSLSYMFYNTAVMNNDLSSWDFSGITNMSYMFLGTESFNQDVSSWDTGNVTNMAYMFSNANAFNQNISSWDTSKVTSMRSMFYNADSFNQDLSDLDISSVTNMGDIFSYSGLSTANYDSMLISWSQLEGLDTYLNLGAYGINYCEGAEARQSLIDTYNWSIYDSGFACPNTVPFVTTWKTDNPGSSNDNQVTITYPGSGDYSIDWGDGSSDANVSEEITHTYATSGSYQISISGTYPRINLQYAGDRSKIVSVDQWGDTQWSTMESAFAGCENVQILATDVPDLSVASSTYNMFNNADSMNTDLSAWDFSNITNMQYMFYDADAFNQNISNWDTSNVTSMRYMFYNADAFDQDLSDLDISAVTSMFRMLSYSGLSTTNYDSMLISWSQLEGLDTYLSLGAEGINYCEGAAARQQLIDTYNWNISDDGPECTNLNPFVTRWKTYISGSPINNIITIPTLEGETYNYTVDWGDGNSDSGVTGDITHVYETPGSYTVSINGSFPRIQFTSINRNRLLEIQQWGDIAWASMESAFSGCSNMDITATDVPDLSQVSSMFETFVNCTSLIGNSSFSNWDVSSVETMDGTFAGADKFNQDIGNWDVSNVILMPGMFARASSFDQDISSWDVSKVFAMDSMFEDVQLSIENYDALLNGWSTQTLQSVVTFDGGNSQYCLGEEARQQLIDTFGWTITDGAKATECSEEQRPFITTWKTDNPGTSADNQITIPTISGETYNYTVDWGDGTSDSEVAGNITHTYASSGTYTVSIGGEFPRIYFNSTGDKDKILLVNQWGDMNWTSMNSAFNFCTNLDVVATDVPNLSELTNVAQMLAGCTSLIGNTSFNDWNMSNVTNVIGMFESASQFNQAIGSWDVSQVQNFDGMFIYAVSFNQDIGDWNVSNGTSFGNMFEGASVFNQDISSWDVSNGVSFFLMFGNAFSFNQDIGSWNLSNATELGSMFRNATSFNQDISGWDVSSVTSMQRMFWDATSFDQNLASWNVSQVTDMSGMFLDATLSLANYDALLNGWSTQTLQSGVTFDGGNSQYCLGEEARQQLIDDFGWIITDGGKAEDCEPQACDDFLVNDDPSIVLVAGTTSSGLDSTLGTTTNTNGSPCAFEISNTDSGQPWARYQAAINLSDYGIEAGDELFIGIDGISSTANARIEVNQDNSPNTALAFNTFSSEWSRFETTVTVPAAIETIDIWLFSNYASSSPGSAVFDNLVIRNNSDEDRPFITTWKTDNPGTSADNQITIPTFTGETYNYTVDWGDGSSSNSVTGNITHTYSAIGTYTVSITGVFPRIHFISIDEKKLLSVDQWGDNIWSSMEGAFSGSIYLDVLAEDVPNLTNVTSMSNMFDLCPNLKGTESFNQWDVSNVEQMNVLFAMSSSFNQDISNWDVSNVIEMGDMFFYTAFNQDISGWDVSSVTKMTSMFEGSSFDQNIGVWNVSNVANMDAIFQNVTLSTENYDAILNGWASQQLQSGVSFSGGNSQYCEGEAARQQLIDDFGWTITDAGKAEDCNPQVCDDLLVNDDPSIVLVAGTTSSGLDSAVGTTTNTNGSPCAFEISNTDSGQPWARYQVAINLSDYGIEAGDELFIGIDGISATANSRIEVNQDNAPNTALAFNTFSTVWSRFESTITVPSGITSIDLWLFSNYASSAAGTAVFDNLVISNLSDTPDLPQIENINLVAGVFDQIEELKVIENGDNIDPINDAGGFNTDLKANVNGVTQSVVFELSGDKVVLNVDSSAPYYLFGEDTIFSNDANLPIGTYSLLATPYDGLDGSGNSGATIEINFTVSIVEEEECPEILVNDDPSIVLVAGTTSSGLDAALGTDINTNGSPCAFEISNNDSGQPWARYQVSLNLANYGIAAGDELFIGIDGNSAEGNARIEVNQDNAPNSALAFNSFGTEWSRFETTITIPSGIESIDLWLFSNYASSSAGTAVFDNLNIVNLNSTGRSEVQVIEDATSIINFGQVDTTFEAAKAFEMTTYPNPSVDQLTVSFTQPTGVKEFSVFDLQGRLIKKLPAGNKAQASYQIDVFDIPPGTYFLRVFDDIGRIHQKQLLIKR